MKKTLQRALVILLALAMLLTVLLPAVSIFAQASTVTQEDIDDLKDQLDDISDRKQEVQEKLASIRDDLAQAKEAVALVNEQVVLTEQQISATQSLIDATQAQIDESQALLDQYDADIAAKEAEIADLEQQEREQLEEYYTQVRWMDEHGSISYLSILFEASSFSELLDYITVIGDLIAYNDRIVTQLQETQAALAEARDQIQTVRDQQAQVQAQLEEQQARQQAQMDQLEAQKAQLEKDRAAATALMDQIAASESEAAEEARKLAAAEAEVQQALKNAERKYAEQLAALNGNANTGEWYWPLPGKTKISSLFGGRYLFGHWESHTGTDIPAPGGTPIHAAKSGVVTYVSPNKNTSYGWYCMISHGNGYVTLYAHQCQRPIVSEGQSVSKGQVIGYVGTTGNSTGNHLHFELRINGVRNDILKLYPGMRFTGYGTSWYGANYPSGMR